MKQEIKEAYNRMNPPQDAKERMMRNIMHSKGGRREYAAAPLKTHWWSAIPAALALIAVLMAGWWGLVSVRETPLSGELVTKVDPTETTSPEEDILETVEDTQVGNSIPEGYTHVLEKYVRAYEEDWTAQEYMQNDICYILASKNIYWQYGYTQTDLNGDGVHELIITDGEEIYDVYMLMEDGGAGHIISATENRAYSLCKDNIIGCHSFGGELDSSWDFSRLLSGGDTELVMYLQKDGNTWSKIEGGSSEMVTISHDEADELIGGTYWHIEIPFQTILREEAEPESELKYPRTYVQMLRELMFDYSGVATMHVARADVTGDSEEELLLGIRSNDSFGHIYSVVDGEVEEILTYGSDINFTLCQDGVICHHQGDKPFGNYVFISLQDNVYSIIEELIYDENNSSWVREKDGVREFITDIEKQEIIDSYGSVSVEWMSVLEAIGG